MPFPVSARDQRVAALALLGLALAAVYWLLVHSWFVGPLQAMNEQLTELEAQQRRYTALLEQRDALQLQVRDARLRGEGSLILLPGGDSGAVAGDLMQKVADQVKKLEAVGPGCKVIQRMPMAAERASQALPYQQVMLSLDLECAIEPLTRLLHALEYSRPLLFVEELNISRPAQIRDPQAAGRLTVHMLVTGYMAAQPSNAANDTGEALDEAPSTMPLPPVAPDPPLGPGEEP